MYIPFCWRAVMINYVTGWLISVDIAQHSLPEFEV